MSGWSFNLIRPFAFHSDMQMNAIRITLCRFTGTVSICIFVWRFETEYTEKPNVSKPYRDPSM